MPVHSFGSLNLDYVYSVDHFVQGGETMAALGRQVFAGGKGLNQSIALARAGAKVYHAGKVGPDGAMLTQLLLDAGADVSHVGVEPDTPTGHAIIQVDSHTGQNCIIIYPGANGCLTPDFIDQALSKARPGEFALFQNETSSLAYGLEQCHKAGLQVAFNPSPCTGAALDPGIYPFVDWLILNEVEGRLLTGEEEPQPICQALHSRYPGCKLVLTLGKAGAMYADGQCEPIFQPAYRVKAVDTTAAGDTFTGYFLAAIDQGAPVAAALELASRAAAISVSRPGAAPSIPLRAEVDAAVFSAHSP